MKAVVENNAVRGPSPRTADTSTSSCNASNGLPSASCAERYVFPTPNVETLKTILKFHGCPEFYVDTIANGYAPREFQIEMTGFWKVRDAFYRLAEASAECFATKVPPRLSTSPILNMIVESAIPGDPLLLDLEAAANSVMWTHRASSTGIFWWPTYIPACFMLRDLLTAIRLCVLHTVWSTNSEALLGVDFSAGLAIFSNETCASIQTLIANAIQSRPALPESTDKSDASTTAEVIHTEHTALTDEAQRLLDVLQDGPKSGRELQELLGVGRTVLLKRFLVPARESGLVVTTEQGSSPNQRYRLVSENETAGEKQASDNIETGLKKPVSASDVLPQKQAVLPKNGVFSSVAVSVFPNGHAPVRLARYNRWQEAERALILFGRVERFLRSSFESGTRKELGIVEKLTATDLIAFENCLFDPKYWGPNAGVVLRQEFVDYNNKHCTLTVGESNLLNLFAQKTGFDLAVCSETERAEMGRLAVIITPAVLHLMNFYAQCFGISRDLDKPYRVGDKTMLSTAVEPFNLYHLGIAKIVFHGKDRAPQLQVARLDVAGRTLLLPITFYASVRNPMLSFMVPEVPDRPILYNADAIAAHPGATVILTDEPGIPLVNDNDSDYIYSSVYGGMEMIDKLDRDQLEGHPLGWLCFDNGDGPVKMYKKAIRVKAIFQKHGLEIAFFYVFDGVTWMRNAFGMDTGTYKGSRVLSFDELKVEAAKYGVDVGESHACADDAPHINSMDELMALKQKEFFLYPLLQEGFYCLIYAGSGVAKTWFALHIAIALTQGTIPFEGWEFRGKAPLNVLYVAGEMRPEEYGKRINELLAGQKTNPRFGLLREKLDLTTPEHQARVRNAVKKQKSKVVVLDNLSTLADNGHTEKQFKKIHSFIEDFQADGLTVILVHHENREGEFKGSGRISLVADISLHLFRAGNGTKIELLVQPDKARSVSSAEFPSFHTEFDPENPTVVWLSRPLTPEERCRLDIDDPLGEVEQNIGKKRKNNQLAWEYQDEDGRGKAIVEGMLNGCHDDVIAADLAVREPVIADFKQEHGISSDTLTKCLPEAMSSQKISPEKMVPDKMAPIIWNILKNNKK